MEIEFIRKIDALGRIIIPIDVRKALDLKIGDDIGIIAKTILLLERIRVISLLLISP